MGPLTFPAMKQKPDTGPAAAAEAARRRERLAAALRDNLRKRKEQARGRNGRDDEGEPAPVEPPGPDR